MLTIGKCRGRLGNKLFAHCCGRIVAEKLGYATACEKIDGFSNIVPIDGERHKEKLVVLTPQNFSEIINNAKNGKHYNLAINFYFQQYDFYKPHKQKIKEWTKPDLLLDRNDVSQLDFRVKSNSGFEKIEINNILPGDVLLQQRLGNFVRLGWDVGKDYFNFVLKNIKFDRLFITSDELKSDFFDCFKKYDPIFLFGTPLVHYSSVFLFDKLIISHSTFSWWAAWTSGAKEIYFPITVNGTFSEKWIKGFDVNLIVNDEERYKMIKEIPKESDYVFQDKQEFLNNVGFRNDVTESVENFIKL